MSRRLTARLPGRRRDFTPLESAFYTICVAERPREVATKIERLFIPGPAGSIEALLEHDPEVAPAYSAVVCHPHPLFGGTMHTKAVFRAAKAASLQGAPALRFNFRGVGLSEGSYDHGLGEQDDVRAALHFLSARYPEIPIVLMGFSFGSAIGLRVGASDGRVRALVGMGLPVKSYDYSFLDDCTKPKLFVEGGNDEYGPRDQVEALVARFAQPKRLRWVEGADHFFTGHLREVERAIGDFLMEVIPRPSRRT